MWMKQNKWYDYNQCNPTRCNQKSEARQAIDDIARAKKRLIKHQCNNRRKRAAKRNRPSSNGSQSHINEAINNQVWMKQNKWYNYNQCNPTRSYKNQKQETIDELARKKQLIKHQMRQQKKKK